MILEMNVLMISANYPPKIGGPSATVPLLSKYLADTGFNVQVLTEGFRDHHQIAAIDENFTVHRIGCFDGYTSHSIAQSIRSIISIGKFGIKLSHNSNFDIVHSHDPNISAISGLIIKFQAGIPGVVKYSGDLVWEFLSLRNKLEKMTFEEMMRDSRVSVGFLRLLEKKIIDGYEKVIVQTMYQRKVLQKFLGIKQRKIVVIPNSVTIHELDKTLFLKIRGLYGDKVILSTACRLVPWKGLNYLIEALRYLPNEFVLLIFGEGPDKINLEKLSKELKVQERVRFCGKIPHKKIQSVIKATDVFILPSLYEPAGVALLDAFAAGVPVIASRVGGIPEIIHHGKNGLLAKPGDAMDIAEKVTMVTGDSDFVEKMRLRQKEVLMKYDLSNLITRYVDVYGEIRNK